MPVVPLREDQDDRPLNMMPAIRTPDQFREAHDRVTALLDGVNTSDLSEAIGRVEQAVVIRKAMDASPFVLANDNTVITRGARLSAVR